MKNKLSGPWNQFAETERKPGPMYTANPIVPVMVSLIVPWQTVTTCLLITREDARRLQACWAKLRGRVVCACLCLCVHPVLFT